MANSESASPRIAAGSDQERAGSGVAPRRRASGRAIVHLVVAIITILWLIPTVGLLVSSFRSTAAVASTGWWTALIPPYDFTLNNYVTVITTNNIGQSFVNSLFVAVPATIMPLLVAAFAAYAFSWMSFRARDALFFVVVGLLVIPLQTTLIPVLQLYTNLGLGGTFPGIWLAHTGYGLPFAIFLLRNFFSSLPREMMEAAAIDGASPLDTFFRLVLPTSVPALAALAIFQFLWVWNDLLVALIYLGGEPSVAPLTVTVSNLVSSLGQGWELLTAAAFVSMLLPLAVFFGLQRYFVAGILAGSVKG